MGAHSGLVNLSDSRVLKLELDCRGKIDVRPAAGADRSDRTVTYYHQLIRDMLADFVAARANRGSDPGGEVLRNPEGLNGSTDNAGSNATPTGVDDA